MLISDGTLTRWLMIECIEAGAGGGMRLGQVTRWGCRVIEKEGMGSNQGLLLYLSAVTQFVQARHASKLNS